jgi:hypothetical protein
MRRALAQPCSGGDVVVLLMDDIGLGQISASLLFMLAAKTLKNDSGSTGSGNGKEDRDGRA